MGKTERRYPVGVLIASLVFSLILQLIECYYLCGIRGDGFGIKASAFLYSFIIILIFFSRRIQIAYESNSPNIISSIIEYVGKISFGIYLIHMYIVKVFSKFIGIDNWGIKWLLVMMFSMAVIYSMKKLLPNKITSKYLGFL